MAFLCPNRYFNNSCGKDTPYRAEIFSRPAFQAAWRIVKPAMIQSGIYSYQSHPDRYCAIFEDRYTLEDGRYYTLSTLAKIHGLSLERIRQIISRIQRHMALKNNINLVSDYCYNLGIHNLSFNTQTAPRHNAYLIELNSLDCDPHIYEGRRQ